MKEPVPFKVWVIDDEIEKVKEDTFLRRDSFNSGESKFHLTFCDDPKKFINDLTFLAINPDAVLLDINFEHLKEMALTADYDDKHTFGLELLKRIKSIDPSLPVLMMTLIQDKNIVFEAGSAQADDYIDKGQIECEFDEKYPSNSNELGHRIRLAWIRCVNHPVYDREHLAIADNFSNSYDKSEQSKAATVAYYHFENELILRLIDEKLDNGLESVKILDIGCGTGRIEELISSKPELHSKVEIVATDFSGNMLKILKNKIEAGRISPPERAIEIIRAPVEVFSSFHEKYKEYFDIVLAGFGLLSYVNYRAVLPPFKAKKEYQRDGKGEKYLNTGLRSLLKPEGFFLFSVYNEDSMIYDTIATLPPDNEKLSIAAVLNMSSGILKVAGNKIACEAFNKDRTKRFLRQAGFSVNDSDIFTFPSIHLNLDNLEIMKGKVPGFAQAGDPLFTHGFFSPYFYEVDVKTSNILKDRGHYIVGVVKRPLSDDFFS